MPPIILGNALTSLLVHPNSCHFHNGTIPLLLHHWNYFRLPGPWRRIYSTSWPHLGRTPLADRELRKGLEHPQVWGRKTSKGCNGQEPLSLRDQGSELPGAGMPYVLPGPGNEPVPPAGMAEIPAWALPMPAQHLQHGDKELCMCSSRGKPRHQRQEGQQHRGEERRGVPEGLGRAGNSYRKGRAAKSYWTGVFKRCLQASPSWSIIE